MLSDVRAHASTTPVGRDLKSVVPFNLWYLFLTSWPLPARAWPHDLRPCALDPRCLRSGSAGHARGEGPPPALSRGPRHEEPPLCGAPRSNSDTPRACHTDCSRTGMDRVLYCCTVYHGSYARYCCTWQRCRETCQARRNMRRQGFRVEVFHSKTWYFGVSHGMSRQSCCLSKVESAVSRHLWYLVVGIIHPSFLCTFFSCVGKHCPCHYTQYKQYSVSSGFSERLVSFMVTGGLEETRYWLTQCRWWLTPARNQYDAHRKCLMYSWVPV